jgi:hypothetical protein
MPNNLDQTGVIQVDGAWATSVKYAAEALGPNVGSVELRFMQGRAEVGRVAVSREHLSELLGRKTGARSSAISRTTPTSTLPSSAASSAVAVFTTRK